MGDNYLRAQAGNFRKQRDLAFQELSTPGLPFRPDITKQVYTAKPYPEQAFEMGESLVAVLEQGDAWFSLLRGNLRIGFVDGESAAALIQDLFAVSYSTIGQVEVIEIAPISGVAKIILLE